MVNLQVRIVVLLNTHPKENTMIYVAKDARGDYNTIEDALNSIPSDNKKPITIYVYNGVYVEKLTINVPYVTLVGESKEHTIITHHHYSKMIMPDGSTCGTFRTSTLFIDANHVTIKNITIANSSGGGSNVGKAMALYADGDNLIFENCRILGYQNTLFTGPLPPTPHLPNGFIGPKEYSPRVNGRQYYKSCYIEGDIDFIFGSATAFFEDCILYSLYDSSNSNRELIFKGYVTAPSTPKGQEYGYIFYQCKFLSNGPDKTVYLGRPWRNYGKVVLIDCVLGPHIKDEGWYDWNKVEAQGNSFYAEYNSLGPGAYAIKEGKRVPWSYQLSTSDMEHYKKDKVLGNLSLLR